MGKRSITFVLAVLVAVAGLALVAPTAPAGAVAPPRAKVFTVSAAPATSVWSQTVKLTAVITPKGGGTPKGGTVTFLSDGVPVGTATATTRNTTLLTSTLSPGEHTITAAYSGDAVTAAGTSTTAPVVTVNPAPTTITLKASPNPVPYDEPAEIKAIVTAVAPGVPTRRPTGTVTFLTDTCVQGTVRLNANGVATWRPWLCPGEHEVTAVYNGSEQHAATGPSLPLTVVVESDEGTDGENIDQVNEGEPGGFLAIADDGETSSAYAQTFTAGRLGRLYAVDLIGLWFTETETPPGPLEISIQTVDGDGNPTGSVLGSGQIATSEVEQGMGETFHVDLDTPADVEQGVTYALVLEVAPQAPDAYGTWMVLASDDDAYPGDVRDRLDGAPWAVHDDHAIDVMFRTHVGDPV